MRKTIGLATLLMALSGSAMAEESAAAVIQQQMDAFVARDVDRAFEYASQAIRNIFRTPQNFGQMVQQGYPMVWDPEQVTMGDQRELGERIEQRVIITDQSGAVHELLYEMIPAGEGWLINGVQILRAPQLGA